MSPLDKSPPAEIVGKVMCGYTVETAHPLLDVEAVPLQTGSANFGRKIDVEHYQVGQFLAGSADGARTIRAAVSHCILNEVAVERLKTGLIDELITTNSVPVDTRGLPITVLSVAGLLGEAIMRIHQNESVTSLFKIKGF